MSSSSLPVARHRVRTFLVHEKVLLLVYAQILANTVSIHRDRLLRPLGLAEEPTSFLLPPLF